MLSAYRSVVVALLWSTLLLILPTSAWAKVTHVELTEVLLEDKYEEI